MRPKAKITETNVGVSTIFVMLEHGEYTAMVTIPRLNGPPHYTIWKTATSKDVCRDVTLHTSISHDLAETMATLIEAATERKPK